MRPEIAAAILLIVSLIGLAITLAYEAWRGK